jgi:hypothetical protein
VSDWDPIHHEELDDDAPRDAPREARSTPKEPKESEPALILTIPPNMIAGLWSLSEALKENTEAVKALTEAMKKPNS